MLCFVFFGSACWFGLNWNCINRKTSRCMCFCTICGYLWWKWRQFSSIRINLLLHRHVNILVDPKRVICSSVGVKQNALCTSLRLFSRCLFSHYQTPQKWFFFFFLILKSCRISVQVHFLIIDEDASAHLCVMSRLLPQGQCRRTSVRRPDLYR